MVSKSNIAIVLIVALILAGVYLSTGNRPAVSIALHNNDYVSHKVLLTVSDLNNNVILNRTELLSPVDSRFYSDVITKKGTYLVNVTVDGNTTIEKANFNEQKMLTIWISPEGIQFGYAIP